jgi:hypothetical protein
MIGAPIVALGIGTSTASADPGVAVSVNGSDEVGIGDATATSSKGTVALAFNGGTAIADGSGTGDIVIAGSKDSTASFGEDGFNLDGKGDNGLTINREVSTLSVSLCGGSTVSAQSDSIDVSAPCLGVD